MMFIHNGTNGFPMSEVAKFEGDETDEQKTIVTLKSGELVNVQSAPFLLMVERSNYRFVSAAPGFAIVEYCGHPKRFEPTIVTTPIAAWAHDSVDGLVYAVTSAGVDRHGHPVLQPDGSVRSGHFDHWPTLEAWKGEQDQADPNYNDPAK